MSSNNLFKELIEKAKFRFVPVYDLKDNSVYGYKIMKDFDALGYTDKEEVYDLAYDEGILEFFLLKLQEKVYQKAVELGYKDSRLFHTLRINYINDALFFYTSIENLTTRFDMDQKNIVFELKGANDWKNLDNFLEVIEEVNEDRILMFKEIPGFPLNMNMVHFLEPGFIEVMSLETAEKLSSDKDVQSKIIFKIPTDKKYSNEELLEKGVDLAYSL